MDKNENSIEQAITELLIFIQLDACRHDYIKKQHTPFLFDVRQSGISGTLIPTFGFEPDAAFMAGLYPDEANGGSQFWHAPDSSPFAFLGRWTRFFNYFPESVQRVLRFILKQIICYYNQSPALSTARVPFHLLRYFDFPMHCRIDSPGFTESDSLFDILRIAGRSWLCHESPDYKVDINSVVVRAIDDFLAPLEFAYFHIGELDGVGHEHGPESEEIIDTLHRLDKGIEQINKIANKRFEKVHLVIVGDHGMMQVKRHINIWSELKKLRIKLEKDYLVFLDSTMVRFWLFSERAEKLITDMLNHTEGGHILGQDEKDKYHLNYPHNKFGEIIFLVDPGVLIFPNFYQNKKPVKGMHGYAPETPDQHSALLIFSPKVKVPKRYERTVDMRRIFPTLLSLMGLPTPERTAAKSLLC